MQIGSNETNLLSTPDAADPEEESWLPRPPPSHWQLVVDNLAVKGAALVGAVKRLTPPVALACSAR